MPKLNGDLVRHHIAARDWDMAALAREARIPERTLHNITRSKNPDPTKLRRVHRLSEVLGLTVDQLVSKSDGTPDPPPDQPKNEPTHPPKRQQTERTTGPRRSKGQVAA